MISANLRTALGLGAFRYRGRLLSEEDAAVLAYAVAGCRLFVDCGANVGLFTIEACRLMGDDGRVVAFEPVRSTRTALIRNVGLNGLEQVTVLPYALADSWDVAEIAVPMEESGLSSLSTAAIASSKLETVQLAKLDDLLDLPHLADVPTLLKIDVEGAELRLIRGAEKILRTLRPVVLIELSTENLRSQGSSIAEVVELLHMHDYEEDSYLAIPPNHVFRHVSEIRLWGNEQAEA
jgi:FkbM family methyltransferase